MADIIWLEKRDNKDNCSNRIFKYLCYRLHFFVDSERKVFDSMVLLSELFVNDRNSSYRVFVSMTLAL